MQKIKKLNVQLGLKSYPIFIGVNLLTKIRKLTKNFDYYSKIIIVTDRNIVKKQKNKIELIENSLKGKVIKIILPGGEKTKSFYYLESLCEKILKNQIDRRSLILCIGGGVIGDLVGLTSNLLLRGVDFVQIPTTLLSQVDSSVGGKTAINSKYGKNLIGTFNQPKAVIISTNTLKSLEKRHVLAGYAEILKYSLIKDKKFFDWLKKNGKKIISLNTEPLHYAISRSCSIKSDIVSEDEKEKNIREILNFGHTFGHAIESLTGFSKKIIHGEAIFLGMFLALKFSRFLGFCKNDIVNEYEIHLKSLKIPYKLKDYGINLSVRKFIKYLKFDKKVKNDKIKFILLKECGKTRSYVLQNQKKLAVFLNQNLE
jgi:3-dehydroquinate synthase